MKYPKLENRLHTIEVIAKEWFDKSAGNSYFSARITLNDKHVIKLPFQYGYGSQFEYAATDALGPYLGLNLNNRSLFRLCQENEVKLYTRMIEDCKKKDVKEWGE